MSSQWLRQHGAAPPNADQVPVVTSILKDFSAEALGELRTWLEQNPPAVSISSIIGFSQLTQTVLVSKSVAQSIPNSTVTLATWNTDIYDKPDDSMHDTATNNSRLICRVAGRYLASAITEWAPSAGGLYRQVQLYVNGSPVFPATQPPIKDAGTETILANVFPPLDLVINDYVELYVAQDTGGALNLLNTYSRFGLARIA